MLVLLWIVTGLVVLVLMAATLKLAARSRAQAIVGHTVYLVGRDGAIELHQEPDADSPVVAGLVRSSPVTVVGLMTREGQTWYRVQKGSMTPGWVLASQVSTEPP
jgi:hypothetical protein